MGTRAQVYMKDTGVYLYQHYDGYDLPNIVKEALKKEESWSGVEYLTRIIFSEMIKDYIKETTGYGIGTVIHGDIEYLITIEKENIIVEKFGKVLFKGSFSDFINDTTDEW